MTTPNYLSKDDHARISRAVAQAEHETAGEIVTVLADRSDGYTDVALAWAIVASFTAMGLFAAFPTACLGLIDRLMGGWTQDQSIPAALEAVLSLGMLVFAGVMLLQLWAPLKFALVPGPIRTARVHDRAVRAFRISTEKRTHGRTGVVIYLSMREHRAEIVADEAIASQVEPEVWGDAMAAMLAELKQGRTAEGMCAAVGQVGAVLAEHFPRGKDDANELPDRLIEI